MEKRVAIMQPYFLPYIGYFHLVNSVDEFVIYDNIQYTKKGWINRNRILVNGSVKTITLPLKKGSDYLDVGDRYLASSWEQDREKLLNIIEQSLVCLAHTLQYLAAIATLKIIAGPLDSAT